MRPSVGSLRRPSPPPVISAVRGGADGIGYDMSAGEMRQQTLRQSSGAAGEVHAGYDAG